jgi:hypothetical protein
MIKLKDLLLEYKDWIPVVTGIISPQGEIQSTLDKPDEHNSHYGLKYHYGTKWRYNPKTKIVYWPSTNWSEQSDEDLISVENHLHKKYGFEVKDHIDMNFKGGHKYVNAAHGIVKEINQKTEICGLGVVDSNDVVHFKKLTDDEVGRMTHNQVGLPGSRDRFRYFNGTVGWTDTPSSKDVKIAVENFLARHNYPFRRHMGYFGDDVDENYRKDYSSDDKDLENQKYFNIGQEDPETTAKSFCWIWSRADQGLRVKQGKTHGANFGHEIAGNTFKGWYDPEKKAISFVFPEQALRKIGDRKPTEDDIPTIVHRKLESQFGKDNKFFVFESIKHYQLKRLIKEIVLMAKGKK